LAEEVIGGYRLLNPMLTDQNAQIWEVVEVASHRHFCMKVLLPEKLHDAVQRKLLVHEATVARELAHPNIIKVVQVSKDARNPFYVTELFPITSLRSRILRKQRDFIKEHAPRILQQAANALAYMHARGWVHRDVKPDNILANNAGEVRVIDFALAQRMQKPTVWSRLFRRSRVLTQGTRSYMSPEQIRGEYLDGRADMYSFGATMYETVAGRPPFRGASNQDLLTKHLNEKPLSPQAHNPELTTEFANLVLQMLAKKREDRPPDLHQVLMKLKTIRVFNSDSAKERAK
jgi:serine/threonine protein kinase